MIKKREKKEGEREGKTNEQTNDIAIHSLQYKWKGSFDTE